ncbi:MAG: amino acid adenylation domain-containing protein, partial [Acidobacteriota bacterium]
EFEIQVWAVSLIRQASLPRTTSGKLQRRRCRRLFLEGGLKETGRSLLGAAPSPKGEPVRREESFILKALRVVSDESQRRTLLELHLRQLAGRLCGISPSSLDPHSPLHQLGLDSLGAVELRNAIEADLGAALPLGDFLRDSSLAGLASRALALMAEADSSPDAPIPAPSEASAFPLSPGQEALWFEHRLDPENAAYNIAGAVRLLDVDLSALRRSLQDLLQRHAVLRTRFEPGSDDQPIQRIEKRLKLPIQVQDASGWTKERLQEKLHQQARRPFDLSRAPLLRIEIMRLADKEHLMLLAVHHIVADLWSLGVLLQELGQLYSAHLEGTPAALDPFPFQYSDYCLWERQRLQGPEGDRLWDYWKKELNGPLPNLELPSDQVRQPGRPRRAAVIDFRIEPDTAQRLEELGRSRSATLFVTLLAVFQALLHRLSGQSEVLTGSPAACRNRADLAGLAGYFVNPLVLRANFDGDPTFGDLLDQLRQRVLGAFEHQEYPFPWLVNRLVQEREAGLSPLFQVLFTLQNGPLWDQTGFAPLALGMEGPALQIGALKLAPWPLDPPPSPFKLHLAMARNGEELLGRLQYDAGIFEASTARRWTMAFQALLRAATDEPTRPASQIPWLDEAQKHHLLEEWNDTLSSYPTQACIQDLFEEQVIRRPDSVALAWDESTSSNLLSYAELNRLANRLATLFEAAGVRPESRLGVVAEPSLEMIAAFLGALKAGGAYLPLDPASPSRRRDFQIEDAGAVVLTGRWDSLQKLAPGSAAKIALESAWTVKGSGQPLSKSLPPDGLAYVIYTSGSSGRPKGVAVSHRAVLRLVFSGGQLGLSPGDRVSQISSPVFDVSAFEIWGALLRGACLVLVPPSEKLAPSRLIARLRRHGVSLVNLVPSLFKQLVDEDASAFAQVDSLLLAGEVLPPEPVKRVLNQGPPGRLLNVYGPTENAVFSTCFRVRKAPPAGHHIPIGRPIPNTTAFILDTRLEALPLGAVGELHLGGDGLARGYLGRAALTSELFIPHPFSRQPGERLYKSGDAARWLPDGQIEFAGRLDNQIKLRGFRVEPAEIERVLEEHPEVRQAVVLLLGERLVGYVRKEAGGRRQKAGRRERSVGSWQLAVRSSEEKPGTRSPEPLSPDPYSLTASQPHSLPPSPVGGSQFAVRGPEGKPGTRNPEPRTSASETYSLQPTAYSLSSFLEQRLPSYMIPALIVEVEEWPRTASGKIDRKALPTPEVERAQVEGGLPETPLEELVAGVWGELLGLEGVGRGDDFFRLGGHSLLAVQVASRLERAMGREVGVGLLFQASTPARMARLLEQQDREGFADEELPGGQQRPARLPLSFAQQRLWFLDQLMPNSPLYNIAGILSLKGRLDQAALGGSIQAIVQRHESLRTAFAQEDGAPYQQVHPSLLVPVPLLDLSALEGRAQKEMLRRCRTLARLPFDLSSAPLLRTALLRCAGDSHHLLLSFHHSVFDGASLGVFLAELQSEYKAARSGRTFKVQQRVQYPDFAIWQRRRLGGAFIESQLEFWKRTLDGAPAGLELPSDRPRPAQPEFRGRTLPFRIPDRLAGQAARLGRRHCATLFMTLVAAFQTLLHRLSGQTDLLVGVPVANRGKKEWQGLIGLLVNNLVLRLDLSGDPPFQGLLERLRKASLQAYLHQEVPFERLVEELAPQREAGRNPFYQVVFGLQETSLPQLNLTGLKAEPAPLDTGTAKFDLSFFLQRAPCGLEGLAEFSSDLFDATTVRRWIGYYRNLLQCVVEHPEKTLSELDLFDPAQRHQLLLEWNSLPSRWERGPLARSGSVPVLSLFSSCLANTPDTAAVVQQEAVLSYGELGRRASGLADWLRLQGLPPEAPVAVLVPRSPDLIVAFFAILQAGGVYLPLDPDYPAQRIALLIEDSGAKVLFTHSSLPTDARSSCPCVLELDKAQLLTPHFSASSEALDLGPWTLDPASAPDSLAYLIYTSGSTGRPKGSMISHQSLAAYNRVAAQRYRIGPGDRVLQFCSISFDISIEEIVPCLTHGASLVLRTDEMLDSTQHFWKRSAQWALTVMSLPTAFWHELADGLSGGTAALPGALELVIIAGERAIPERLATWRRRVGERPRLVNTYGLTESTVISTIGELGRPSGAWERDRREVSIGRPVDQVQLYLLDRHWKPVAPGALGELFIGGALLGRGYHRRPAATAQRFVPSPFSEPAGDRLYRSGDLARHRPDGELEFLGRIDHQVKLRGFRVELGEIEARLEEHPEVEKAVVRVWDEGGGQKRLAAYVVRRSQESGVRNQEEGNGEGPRSKVQGPKSKAEGSESPPHSLTASQSSSLLNYLKARLPSYMIPGAFVELDKLPLTPNGKVDRQALPRPLSWGADAQDDEPLAGETERRLGEVWRQVLKVGSPGRRAQFFEQGGHSLLAVQMVSRLRKAFGVELPVRALFEHPLLSDLAAVIENAGPQEEAPLLPVPGQPELSHAQQRLWFLAQLDPDSPLYNISAALRLRGELGVAALQAAFGLVAQRHQPLRSRFLSSGGEPVLKVVDDQPVELPLIDLCSLSQEQRSSVSRRLASEEAARPFELSSTAPWRASLLRLAHSNRRQEHILLLSLHHIASDAWSMGILSRELSALYKAVVSWQLAVGSSEAGKSAAANCELPTANSLFPSSCLLPIRYSDYALWQRCRLKGRWMEQQLDFWRRQLKDAPGLELPTDRPPAANPDFRGASLDFVWPQRLGQALQELSRRHQATLFMTLLAAFQALLFRYSGQNDLSVGTPVTNRNRTETESLIGLFVNTLVLRTRLPHSDETRFSQLLGQVRETALDAFAHSEVPFERVVEELQPERSLRHAPLFRVLFALENAPQPSLDLPGLEAEILSLPVHLSKFDLTWTVQIDGETDGDCPQLKGTLAYRSQLFEAVTVQRLLNHLRNLLEGVAANQDCPLSILPLMSCAELHQLSVEPR